MQTLSTIRYRSSRTVRPVLETAKMDLSQKAHHWYLDPAGIAPETRGAKEPPTPPAPWTPRTRLGKELAAIRKQIVASGRKFLTWDEIGEERKARWGSREGE